MRELQKVLVCLLAFSSFGLFGNVKADVLLDKTTLIGSSSVAAPSEFSFTATTAQTLTLTLTDLQAPAAFSALQVGVTLGDALIGTASVDPTTHTASLAIPAATGNYTLRVIGTPDTTDGFGRFGVCIAPSTDATSCISSYSFSGNIQAPSTTSPAGTSTLSTSFTSTTAGQYTVTLTDDAFPVALQAIAGGVSQGSNPISAIGPGTTQITLAAATNYQLLIAAVADSGTQAGLYGIRITDPNGAAVFDHTLPVGILSSASTVENPIAQALNLQLTDFAYPSPLVAVGSAVTQGSSVLASLTAAGTQNNFMAAAGPVEVWQYSVAGGQPGVYGLNLSPFQSAGSASVASLLSVNQVVDPAGNSGGAFAFVVNLTAAGTNNLVLNDFQFPVAFQSLTATVAQNGQVLQQSTNGDFTAAAGPVIVLVSATPPASGEGIFGVTIQTSGAAPQILLDQTQAVGGVFNSQSINVGTASTYDVTLTDLGFPANFQNLALVVSQGSQVLGKIYGGGTFNFSSTPGTYVLTFVATPAAPQDYGLYSVLIASSPPTVSFTSGAASVVAGQTLQLTWTTQNATSCVASGSPNWTGSEPTSGTLAIVVSASATLTLTCAGPGGTTAQSISVTATAAPAKSGGGGGALDPLLLTLLTMLFLASLTRVRR
jgi:hypothetical protein